jgi:hypothetical protein
LYSEGRENVCIIFLTITEFDKFYMGKEKLKELTQSFWLAEMDTNQEGRECIRVLNEIIGDFDNVFKKQWAKKLLGGSDKSPKGKYEIATENII